MMNQVVAVFGAFMTFFYLGVGLFLLFSDAVDRSETTIIIKSSGTLWVSPLYSMGLYRGYRSYIKFKEAFFSKSDETDK